MSDNPLKRFEAVVAKTKQLEYQHMAFPVDVLPGVYAELAKNTADVTDVHLDHICNSLLTVAAACCSNAYKVEVSDNYYQKPIIWSSNIGLSGSQKSLASKIAMGPIFKVEQEWHNEFGSDVARWEQETAELDKKAVPPPRPHRKSMYLEDFTVETISTELKHYPKGLIVFDDELSGFISALNKYRKGNDEQTFMKLFEGETFKVNRVSKDPIFIINGSVSIHGNFTPDFIEELAKEKRSKNGFMQRFFFSWPDAKPLKYWNPKGISKKHLSDYNTALRKIIDLPMLDPLEGESHIIRLSEGAQKEFTSYYNRLVDVINSSDTQFLNSFFSKHRGLAARVALTIELMLYSVNKSNLYEVSAEAMQAAGIIMDYYRNMTIKVWNEMQKEQVRLQEKEDDTCHYKIDWAGIFGNESELPSNVIIARIQSKIKGIHERTCRNYMNRQLERISHGVWRRKEEEPDDQLNS